MNGVFILLSRVLLSCLILFLDEQEVSKLVAEVSVYVLANLMLYQLAFPLDQMGKTISAFKRIVLIEEDPLRDCKTFEGLLSLSHLYDSYRNVLCFLFVASRFDLIKGLGHLTVKNSFIILLRTLSEQPLSFSFILEMFAQLDGFKNPLEMILFLFLIDCNLQNISE